MTRIITAGVVGAGIYFVWGMMAWMGVPFHAPTIHALPAEQTIVDALTGQDLESGVYVAPYSWTNSADMSDPELRVHEATHCRSDLFDLLPKRR